MRISIISHDWTSSIVQQVDIIVLSCQKPKMFYIYWYVLHIKTSFICIFLYVYKKYQSIYFVQFLCYIKLIYVLNIFFDYKWFIIDYYRWWLCVNFVKEANTKDLCFTYKKFQFIYILFKKLYYTKLIHVLNVFFNCEKLERCIALPKKQTWKICILLIKNFNLYVLFNLYCIKLIHIICIFQLWNRHNCIVFLSKKQTAKISICI